MLTKLNKTGYKQASAGDEEMATPPSPRRPGHGGIKLTHDVQGIPLPKF
jgi:hypothetical protein